MKKYEKYKDSGIDWIGEIPAHWDVNRLKNIANANPSNIDKKSKEGEQSVKLCNYMDVYSNDFITGDIQFMEATATENQIGKFILEKGDVLATKDSERADDIGIAAFVKENLPDVVCGYHLTHIKPKDVLGEYLFRLFQTEFIRQNFETEANGVTRYALGVDDFNSLRVLIPPKSEQTTIATYLDQKTSEIDELIADKKRLIELYEEEKKALINQAVTKGLDEDVPMKDSGIEWLGEIPAHWEVKKLKYVLKEKLKYGANETGSEESYENPRYIRITDFGDDGKLRKETFKSLAPEKANEYLLEEGDILFARSGATVGKSFQFKNYNGIACFAGYLIRARPEPKMIISDFLYLYTKSGAYENWKGSIFSQATIQNIGADKFAFLFIPLPPINEQNQIVHHIETECNRIDEQVERTQKLIELLSEYRTALISEVVTGKVRVAGELGGRR